MSTSERPGRQLRYAPLVTGTVAAFLYSNFLLDWVLSGFTGMGAVVSELEAPGQPHATLLRVTDVVCAVLVLGLLLWVRADLSRGFWREVFAWSTAAFALGSVAAAMVAEPCGPGAVCDSASQVLATNVHLYASIVSDTALFVGAFAVVVATWRTGPAWFRRVAWSVLLVVGVASSLVFGYFHRTQDPLWAVGVSQRVHILGMSLWIFCLGLFAATNDRSIEDIPARSLSRSR